MMLEVGSSPVVRCNVSGGVGLLLCVQSAVAVCSELERTVDDAGS
jgi:hypothetical protein